MKLIFLRHAKADPLQKGEKDANRNLTAEGRLTMNQMAQELGGYFSMQGKVEVWSSDYNRAEQTAHILHDHVPKADVSTYKSIRKDELSKLTSRIKSASMDTLIVVGHNPYLEDWFRELTGEQIEIDVNEMLMMHYDPKKMNAHLIWRWKAKKILELCPYRDEMGITVWQWLEECMLSYHLQISSSRKRFQESDPKSLAPGNVDNETKNMRVLLEGLKPLLHQKQYHKAVERYKIGQTQISELAGIDALLMDIREKGKYPKLEKMLWKRHKSEDKILRKDIYSFSSTKLYQKALRAAVKSLRNTDDKNKLTDKASLLAFLATRQPALHETVAIDSTYIDPDNPSQVEEFVQDYDVAERWRAIWQNLGMADVIPPVEPSELLEHAKQLHYIFRNAKVLGRVRADYSEEEEEDLYDEMMAYCENLDAQIVK